MQIAVLASCSGYVMSFNHTECDAMMTTNLFSGSATKRAAPIRPMTPTAPKAVGGMASTPSAICDSTSETPALATIPAPLQCLPVRLLCLRPSHMHTVKICTSSPVLSADSVMEKVKHQLLHLETDGTLTCMLQGGA